MNQNWPLTSKLHVLVPFEMCGDRDMSPAIEGAMLENKCQRLRARRRGQGSIEIRMRLPRYVPPGSSSSEQDLLKTLPRCNQGQAQRINGAAADHAWLRIPSVVQPELEACVANCNGEMQRGPRDRGGGALNSRQTRRVRVCQGRGVDS